MPVFKVKRKLGRKIKLSTNKRQDKEIKKA